MSHKFQKFVVFVIALCIVFGLILSLKNMPHGYILNNVLKITTKPILFYALEDYEKGDVNFENEHTGGAEDMQNFEEQFFSAEKENGVNDNLKSGNVTGENEKLKPLDEKTAKPVKITNLSPVSASGYDVCENVFVNNDTTFKIDVPSLLGDKPKLHIDKNNDAQILIVHTHTTEGYGDGRDKYDPNASERSFDNDKNVVRVGEEMKKVFDSAGYKAYHATEIHDSPVFSGGYSRSVKTVEKYMKKYPSIKMVIDVHRDSITTASGVKYRPVAEINGQKAAQVMLLIGTDQKGMYFPDWRENLKFALDIQKIMQEKYPGLARPVNLRDNRFNMHTTNGSVLLEVGSAMNTIEEAIRGGQYAAECIIKELEYLSE